MTDGPLVGLTVVEVAVGVSDLGLGLAGGVPGRLLADLGASITVVVGETPADLDAHHQWGRAWHWGKEVVVTDDPDRIRELLVGADVALVYGPDELVDDRGLGWADLQEANPGLIHGRCRGDFGLLVEARSGFCTQLAGHRDGPIFVDVRASGAGAAFLLTASVLDLLRRRALTGTGGWAETSLYDGMLATLGCMIGRADGAPDDVEGYWEKGSTFPNFLYRCADGELLQVWFGGKGMYPKLIEVLGDEPSPQGYYADQVSGMLRERAVRWLSRFTARPRDEWIGLLRAEGIACEPVLAPGEALADPHLAKVGVAVPGPSGEIMVGSPISVTPVGDGGSPARLDGLRVVDFSAFVAGPLGAQVLGDLGAEVIKVEPPGGEAMRAAAYAVAACQRGKRSLALDLGAPDARPVIDALLEWADVVLHNFRVGVSARLGIDETTVAGLNPGAVYCHASAFGPHGPRAKFPGNDALMQALTGFERAVGGEGNEPTAGTWIPLDMCGGWVAAIGILAGLYARATTGAGQQVATSLLGAAMLVQSGVFLEDGDLVPGPSLDQAQTGYGPGYRIYQGSDGRWFAMVVPDEGAWERLSEIAEVGPYAPLRGGARDAEARAAEEALGQAFAAAPAAEWVDRLRALGVAVEPVTEMDRDQFRQGILDAEDNRALGRSIAYDTPMWGHFEQIGPLLRTGPDPREGPPLLVPGVGQHTTEVLTQLGFTSDQIASLLELGVAHQGD